MSCPYAIYPLPGEAECPVRAPGESRAQVTNLRYPNKTVETQETAGIFLWDKIRKCQITTWEEGKLPQPRARFMTKQRADYRIDMSTFSALNLNLLVARPPSNR